MPDTESLSKAPREVTLAGKVYLVSKLEFGEWQRLNAFIKDRGKDPVVAALESLSRAKSLGIAVDDAARKDLFALAQRQARSWPPPLCSEDWFAALNEAEGGSALFVATVLRKNQPGVTDAEVEAVNTGITGDEAETLTYRVLGLDPPPKDPPPAGGQAGPDAGPATTTGPTPSAG